MTIETPYYLIDERKLQKNLKKIQYVREKSGARSVLALKCFSTWGVFGLMKKYMDGTTSSSLYEARLGYEKFGKEVHAYCVGFSKEDVQSVKRYADKIIFNSVSQLDRFCRDVRGLKIGLRVNPGISYSHFDLADPSRKYSRLGVVDKKALTAALPRISGRGLSLLWRLRRFSRRRQSWLLGRRSVSRCLQQMRLHRLRLFGFGLCRRRWIRLN
jgi:carboxynorspermidine decarboxylase